MGNDIRNSVIKILSGKLDRAGIRPDELGEHLDLVKSGLVNSLEFVDMVASLEKEFGCEIDYEAALETGDLTTFGGLVRTFEKYRNE